MLKRNNSITMIILYFLFFISACNNDSSSPPQESCSKSIEKNRIIYSVVDKLPIYKNKPIDVLIYLSDNIKIIINSLNQTKVDLQFIVLENGKVSDVGIYNKKESEYTDIDKEYIKVLSMMPKWQAGECNGKKVAVKIRLTIRLDLSL